MTRPFPDLTCRSFRRAAALTAFAILAAAGAMTSHSAAAGELRVAVEGVKGDQGSVRVAIYRAGSKFLAPGQEYSAMYQQARAGDLTVVFGDLPNDRYAVAVFHDENGNAELDANLLGIPLEGIAFSERAAATFGPPSFDAAALTVPAEGQVTTHATMSY